MSAREDILNAVTQATTARGARSPDAVTERIAKRANNVIPARGGAGSKGDKISREIFIDEAVRAGAYIEQSVSMDGVPGLVSEFLKSNNIPGILRVSTDPGMAHIPWQDEPLLTINTGPAEASDPVGVGIAQAGVAETGTVLMASSPERPAMVNMVPLINIVLLPESRLFGNYEQSLDLIRDNMPRLASYITGPSRTADIELELLMGAHGPQELLIILIEDA